MIRVAGGVLALVMLATACDGQVTGDASTTAAEAASAVAPTDTELAGAWEFEGADGVVSTITDTSRIVTLSGDLTEIVFALGLGDSVVAVDVTTVEPEAARGLPIVGVGRFLTPEGVLAEEPTLVIGDTQTSPPESIEQIRDAGVPVVILEVPTSFDDLYAKLASMGEVLGVPEAGAEVADRVRQEVDSVLETISSADPSPGVAFVYSRGPDVMLLFGEEMTTRPMIEAVGGRDVGAASGVVGTVSVTPESLIAAAPDVIVTTTEGLDALGGVDGMLAIPGVAETPAGQSRRILAYPEGDFLTFGPRIAESLELLADDLAAILGS